MILVFKSSNERVWDHFPRMILTILYWRSLYAGETSGPMDTASFKSKLSLYGICTRKMAPAGRNTTSAVCHVAKIYYPSALKSTSGNSSQRWKLVPSQSFQ